MFGYSFDELLKLAPIFGFLGTIVSLIFAGLQVRNNTQIQRAKFLVDLANRDLNKDGAWDLFFNIEDDKFKISDMVRFHESKEAVALDALLYQFNLVGRLVRMSVISLAEADFFEHEINTVLKNPQVLEYLQWLETRKKRTLYPDARSLVNKL